MGDDDDIRAALEANAYSIAYRLLGDASDASRVAHDAATAVLTDWGLANPIWLAVLADEAVRRSLSLPRATNPADTGAALREAVRQRLTIADRDERSVAALHHLAGYPIDFLSAELGLSVPLTQHLADVLEPPSGISYRPLGDPILLQEPSPAEVVEVAPPTARRSKRGVLITLVAVGVVVAVAVIVATGSVGDRPSLGSSGASTATTFLPPATAVTSGPSTGIASAGCSQPSSIAGSSVVSSPSGRTFRLAAPEPADLPHDLVVALPGYGQTAESFASTTGLETAGTAAGYFVATLDPTSPDLELTTQPSPDPSDDVAAVVSMIDQVAATQCIDPRSVHLVGFGPGAQLAGLIACQRSDAVATVTAVGGGFVPTPCTLSKGVSLLSLWANDDDVLPVEGGYGSSLSAVAPAGADRPRPSAEGAEQIARHWASLVGTRQPVTTTGSDGSKVVQYDRGQTSADVRLVIAPAGGHAWTQLATDSTLDFIRKR